MTGEAGPPDPSDHPPDQASDVAYAGSAFAQLGGEVGVRALVDQFYDLMSLEPEFHAIRRLHPESIDGSRDKLFWFLCGWLGGPQHYVERHGHPRLRARHLPFSIGIAERDQWMACMERAMQAMGFELDVQHRLTASFLNTADWMRNRGV